MDKIKIVWVCSFSNEITRKHLSIKHRGFIERLAYRVLGRNDCKEYDTAIWNTNALKEFEKFDDVDLHVICPVRGLNSDETRYELNNIHYYFFREENSSFYRKFIRQCITKFNSEFRINRRKIKKIVEEIKPDLVHVIGAENPHYSMALLDIPTNIPTIIQLQALLVSLLDKDNIKNDSKRRKSFGYKGLIEERIIKRADYIGVQDAPWVQYIQNKIKPEAIFLNLRLALAHEINFSYEEKVYDFVYYAAYIKKAVDYAIEAFALAHKANPSITLDIIGDYDDDFKTYLNQLIEKLGIKNAVTFEGLLPTHDDVIRQIKKARFALLPYKNDTAPTTLHEAMANGLPVVTTITEGTPELNFKRESVLISEQGDYQAMADNMLRLLRDDKYADTLRRNAGITESELGNNHDFMRTWIEAYQACIDNYQKGISISKSLLI